MLTKRDLDSIQSTLKPIFAAQKKEIVDELTAVIQKNTDDLVELITTGFNIQSRDHKKNLDRINNHEYRIKSLEKKVCPAN